MTVRIPPATHSRPVRVQTPPGRSHTEEVTPNVIQFTRRYGEAGSLIPTSRILAPPKLQTIRSHLTSSELWALPDTSSQPGHHLTCTKRGNSKARGRDVMESRGVE